MIDQLLEQRKIIIDRWISLENKASASLSSLNFVIRWFALQNAAKEQQRLLREIEKKIAAEREKETA